MCQLVPYSIPGYNHVAETRCGSRGGGISLFVSEKCVHSEITDYCMGNDYIESLFVKITNNFLQPHLIQKYKNKLNTLLKIEEKKYYQSLILANKNNLKKTWGIIKQVINKSKCSKLSSEFSHNGSILNDKRSIANIFDYYFVNIEPTLVSKIPQLGIDYRNFLPHQNNMSFFFSPVEELEVKKIILQLKDGALGNDGIMSKAIKCISDHVAASLTRLTNLSLSQGVFPNGLKIALVSLL